MSSPVVKNFAVCTLCCLLLSFQKMFQESSLLDLPMPHPNGAFFSPVNGLARVETFARKHIIYL